MSRYLKQTIVIRKDLCMPTGKVAAMAAHASMSFLLPNMRTFPVDREGKPYKDGTVLCNLHVTPDQARWLTELDPGIEETEQVSMAKIVCQADNEEHLLAVEKMAKDAGLTCHRVIDSGYSHNKPGTFVAIAIGPHWPEQLEPVTGALKLYR